MNIFQRSDAINFSNLIKLACACSVQRRLVFETGANSFPKRMNMQMKTSHINQNAIKTLFPLKTHRDILEKHKNSNR